MSSDTPHVPVVCGGCSKRGWVINWNRYRVVTLKCGCGWITHKDTEHG